jgi:two-component system response regulator NreC
MRTDTIKVIIADDHDVYRMGLRMLLGGSNEIELIGEAANGLELIELANQNIPDVVLTDLIMPEMDGIEAIRRMKNDGFTKCIALSNFNSDRLIMEALEAGAKGYMIKNAEKGEIVEAIKQVKQSGFYYCKSTSARLARMIGVSELNPYIKTPTQIFTDEEIDIVRLICLGKTSEEIGKSLFIGKRNVERIRTRILSKMDVKTVAGVVMYAIKNSIIDVDSQRF